MNLEIEIKERLIFFYLLQLISLTHSLSLFFKLNFAIKLFYVSSRAIFSSGAPVTVYLAPRDSAILPESTP